MIQSPASMRDQPRLRIAWRAFVEAASRWRGEEVSLELAMELAERLRRAAGEAEVSVRTLHDATDAILTGLSARHHDAGSTVPDWRHAAAIRAAIAAAGDRPDPSGGAQGTPSPPATPAALAEYVAAAAAWRGTLPDRRAAAAWADVMRRRRGERFVTATLIRDLVDAVSTGRVASLCVARDRVNRRHRTIAIETADRAAGPPEPRHLIEDEEGTPAALPTRERWSEFAAAAATWRGAKLDERDPLSWADAWRRRSRRPRVTDELLTLAVAAISAAEAGIKLAVRGENVGPDFMEGVRRADLAAGVPVPAAAATSATASDLAVDEPAGEGPDGAPGGGGRGAGEGARGSFRQGGAGPR
ncbi:MAG TPA: hypothetical protein PKC43_06615 [Phycisphaerales bacterium]|nr:hypothetical protein [Phycisphaerales bacterium]